MASKKSTKFKVGEWVEFVKGQYAAPKGTAAVVSSVVKAGNGWDQPSEAQYGLVWMSSGGESESSNISVENASKYIKKAKAPQFVVAWSDEYTDPFCYARTLAEAKKLAARNRVQGLKVIEARVFKAVK